MNVNPIQNTITNDAAKNPISLDVSVNASNVGVAGSNLWVLSAFGSSNDDGSGEKFGEVRQVLMNRQRDETFLPRHLLNFGRVNFNLDTTDTTCSSVQYICVTLSKHEESTTIFYLIPAPGLDDRVFTTCVPAKCEGKLIDPKS